MKQTTDVKGTGILPNNTNDRYRSQKERANSSKNRQSNGIILFRRIGRFVLLEEMPGKNQIGTVRIQRKSIGNETLYIDTNLYKLHTSCKTFHTIFTEYRYVVNKVEEFE